MQDDPYANPKPLRISGTPEAVDRAMAEVREIIKDPILEVEPEIVRDPLGPPTSADITSNLSAYKSVHADVQVPRFAVGSVIGRAGDTIKRVQAETGARIQFDQDTGGPQPRVCSISGTQEMVDRAERIVRGIIADVSLSRPDRTAFRILWLPCHLGLLPPSDTRGWALFCLFCLFCGIDVGGATRDRWGAPRATCRWHGWRHGRWWWW